MSVLRSLARSIRLAGYFVRYGAELVVRQPATREDRADWLHRFASAAVRGLGVEIEVEGNFPEHGALISNHLGYLDIVVFAALRPCVFVSKVEVASYPILGWMTTMAGTVYVARGQGGSAAKAKAGMDAALHAGLPVVFFPEGTTSNGTGMLKFHGGLLSQVLAADAAVTAGHLCYSMDADNGEATVSDDICYWGDDVQLLPHIFGLLGLKGVKAHVRFAEAPIAFTSDPGNRKRAAQEAWVAVAELSQIDTAEMHHF